MSEIITVGTASVAALTWLANKVLGPTFDEIGKDISVYYRGNISRILKKTEEKIKDIDDGYIANRRVAEEVLSSGKSIDDELSAEYYAGILASSRSEDGKEDRSVTYLAILKSMSAHQVLIHYNIYNALEKKLFDDWKTSHKISDVSRINKESICLLTKEETMPEDLMTLKLLRPIGRRKTGFSHCARDARQRERKLQVQVS